MANKPDILTQIEKRKPPMRKPVTRSLYQVSDGCGRVTIRLYPYATARKIVSRGRAMFGLDLYMSRLTVVV